MLLLVKLGFKVVKKIKTDSKSGLTRVPIALIQGSKDKIVSPETNGLVNGSNIIYRNAVASGIPGTLKLHAKFRDELQRKFNPLHWWKTKKRWLQAGNCR